MDRLIPPKSKYYRRLPYPEKIICMISGGMDSAVASYMFLRRGFAPIFTCFDIYPYVNSQEGRTAFQVVTKLKRYSPEGSVRMYIVPHARDLKAIIDNCPRRLTCIICRRMMFRKAEKIAMKEEAGAIVTGESLGQKASQTLVNLYVTAHALKGTPLLRPLIGVNKEEIAEMARKIGVYDVATRASCTASPKKPSTATKLKDVLEAEKRLDLERLVEQDLEESDVIDVAK